MPKGKARNPYREPDRCIQWKRIAVWTTVYENGAGDTITVTSVTRPKKHRNFRSTTGKRKFTAQSTKRIAKEVIIVARKKKDAEVEEIITDEELEELEGLEDLDDELEDEEFEEDEELEDEDEDEDEPEDEDEDEEDEDEEEEEPAPRKKRKPATKSKKSPPKKKSAAERGVVGTVEVAEACGTTPRQLRIVLRRFQGDPFVQDEDSGRWEWSSLNHPHVKKLVKMFESGNTGGRSAKDDEAKAESTTRKTKAAKARATAKTKSGTRKRRRAA